MVQLPLLVVPDFTQTFVVETDASSKGIGTVLMQQSRPLAFWSQGLSLRAQQKSVYERELMALVQAIQRWRHYLLGRHFIVKTDQKSLKFLTDQRLFTEEQFKWAVKLIGMDFEIQFKPGKENQVADALSRREMYAAISLVSLPEKEDWTREVTLDPKWKQLVQDLIVSPSSHEGYEFRGGLLLYKGRLVLARDSNRISTLSKECHTSPMGGHSGFFRTYKRLASCVFGWE
ncbi:hypothetical protein TanjilG_01655 [Lupinus angustifolius]|uniref:Reverse transcriptase RNase H-like domain-containing protein n=1 Tax=Lupinus angustifolius TaxID=3871 RepID=A0A1J7GG45_LUPAN|nr:hypothetical protein TanjilG_01655 [Lupinus angustifolius]